METFLCIYLNVSLQILKGQKKKNNLPVLLKCTLFVLNIVFWCQHNLETTVNAFSYSCFNLMGSLRELLRITIKTTETGRLNLQFLI